jgi:cyclic pyranopterin phosphate synthase
MRDSFGRTIRYLRISVTDRCNLRCYYCLHEADSEFLERSQLLTYEEITEVVRNAIELGFNKFRLTGGEPLVRTDIISLVEMIGHLDGVEDFGMTTNGVLLDRLAIPLFKGGLHRLNISLDTVDPECYREKTNGGDITRVLDGIQAAKAAGFTKIKINCVIEKSSEELDARGVAAWAAGQDFDVRFIRHMNLAQGTFWVVEGGLGGKCDLCDRLRLSSDGVVRPCLFSDLGFSVRELGAREALERAAGHKPQSGETCNSTTFRRIGG